MARRAEEEGSGWELAQLVRAFRAGLVVPTSIARGARARQEEVHKRYQLQRSDGATMDLVTRG